MIDLDLPLDRLPDPLPVEPLRKTIDASIRVPGSKSITNRLYLLAALSRGTSRIGRPLRADDTDALLAALRTLGAEARWEGDNVEITGVAGRFPRGGSVSLGDGGTPTRFMIAAACLAAEPVVVDGSPRMRERPIAEGVDLLRAIGATIEYVEEEGRLPVRVVPSALRGGVVKIGATQSSQFVSALMLIAPWLPDWLSISFLKFPTSESYLRLTAHLMKRWAIGIRPLWGIEHPETGERMGGVSFSIPPAPGKARDIEVEADASSAAFWFAAAAMSPGSRLELPGLRWPSEQPDLQIIVPLRDADVDSEGLKTGIVVRGPERLRPFACDASLMPDGAMSLAVVAARAEGRSLITGLGTLRVKETDRIAALASELRAIGCTVKATDDSLEIDPSTRHRAPVVIETYDDHRMAMAFAVLGLVRPGISIANPGCVAKSYPGFWRDLARLYR